MSVLIETSLGDIVIDLLTKERPRASLNFLKLCKLKMYNFCLFHNIQRNFMIQSGDIDEKGGSSVFKTLYGEQAKFFEREAAPKIKHTDKFTVSMVNDGNGFHGSQFLITTVENADTLDDVHTVFGKIAEGSETVAQINEVYCDGKGKPFQDIRINHTIVLHDPFEDPGILPIPPRSPSPPPHVIDSERLVVGEQVNEAEGHTTEEMLDYIEEKELKANTQMLEIIGDIPDADVKPPENVLFICKLNPVTSSDDLEIIFSRFGPIKSCEVIRDWKTGDSLCYAFVEFEEVTDCETAYFKMDNVLIDERRIHVDFSQSVSKIYWNRNSKNQMKYNGVPEKKSHDRSRDQPADKRGIQQSKPRDGDRRDSRNAQTRSDNRNPKDRPGLLSESPKKERYHEKLSHQNRNDRDKNGHRSSRQHISNDREKHSHNKKNDKPDHHESRARSNEKEKVSKLKSNRSENINRDRSRDRAQKVRDKSEEFKTKNENKTNRKCANVREDDKPDHHESRTRSTEKEKDSKLKSNRRANINRDRSRDRTQKVRDNSEECKTKNEKKSNQKCANVREDEEIKNEDKIKRHKHSTARNDRSGSKNVDSELNLKVKLKAVKSEGLRDDVKSRKKDNLKHSDNLSTNHRNKIDKPERDDHKRKGVLSDHDAQSLKRSKHEASDVDKMEVKIKKHKKKKEVPPTIETQKPSQKSGDNSSELTNKNKAKLLKNEIEILQSKIKKIKEKSEISSSDTDTDSESGESEDSSNNSKSGKKLKHRSKTDSKSELKPRIKNRKKK